MKSRQTLRLFSQTTALSALMLVALSFQNCAKQNFALIEPEAKLGKLESENVFDGGGAEVPASGASSGRGRVPASMMEPGLAMAPVISTSQVPLFFICSQRQSKEKGNLSQATSLKVILQKEGGGESEACQFTENGFAAKLLNDRKISVALLQQRCGALTAGNYQLRISDAARDQEASLTVDPARLQMRGGQLLVLSGAKLISDFNDEISKGERKFVSAQINPGIACDDNASPLVIHLNSDVEKAEPLILTSQANGVRFDLLGRNADGKEHTKSQISWHRSHQYLYIVLPNAKGEVKGIDELFGDNTFGPDGKFASDGYHALAKYDGKSADGRRVVAAADGYISDADAIFGRLRLWQDRNFNGIAEKGELMTLKSKGIEVVDLNFDTGYRETDLYGNQTKFKSVVKTSNGKLHLLFDIWFNPLTKRGSVSGGGLAAQ